MRITGPEKCEMTLQQEEAHMDTLRPRRVPRQQFNLLHTEQLSPDRTYAKPHMPIMMT